MHDRTEEVTLLLASAGDGDTRSIEKLWQVIYDELRQLAHSKMSREPAGHTLQPTALVHEAFLRLVRNEDQHWENRRHFFSAAAEAMRRILIDRARKHHSEKRGGGKRRVEFDPDVIDVVTEERSELLLHLEEALQELERLNERQAQIVKLRYFTGLTIEETAKILGVSTATVVQDWRFARAWLKERMAPSG